MYKEHYYTYIHTHTHTNSETLLRCVLSVLEVTPENMF